jgi:hypothetical protein
VLNLARVATPTATAPSARLKYYYQVAGCGLVSEPNTFSAPVVGHLATLTAVLTADMGATTPDRISQHWAESDAYATTAREHISLILFSRTFSRRSAPCWMLDVGCWIFLASSV